MVLLGVILIAALCSTTAGTDTLDTTTLTATSATNRSCDQAILDFDVEFLRVCAVDEEECPAGCYELIDQLNVVCDGARVDLGGGFEVYEAGFVALILVENMLEVEGLPCTDVPLDAFFASAAFKPSCADALAVTSVLLNVDYRYFSSCQVALLDNSSCPEQCESLLGATLATCSMADLADNATNWWGALGGSAPEVPAEELLARVEALITPSCAAALEMPFLTTTLTSATSTSSFTTPLCQGDRLTFDIGYGDCSTYAPGEYNEYYCGFDLDQDSGLYAEQVCSECGECSNKVTETESSATTETSTTTTVSDTTSSATTTTYTTATLTATNATWGPCDRAILDFVEVFPEACAVDGEECPTGCYELIDQLNVVCDGVRVNVEIGREEYSAGLVTLSMVDDRAIEDGLPCKDVPLDAFFSSAVFEPTCVDALAVTSVLLGADYPYFSPCQAALSDSASCPQECGSLLGAALASCSAADLHTATDWLALFGESAPEVSTEELLARVEALIVPSCAAILQMPFSTATNTYTTAASSGNAGSSTSGLRGSGGSSTSATLH